ncbi:MAG: hypothetical protein J0L53_00730 [Spirochaetes bacterium]|nr:hypothetical protein [Spirochaetota bacterium]MBX3721446.1 hypothetical protein [Turneriella sp.]
MGLLESTKSRVNEIAATNEKIGFFREKIWPELEKFLIAGPTFVGFVIGLWRYAPGSRHFETAFQSLILFAGYMLAMIFLQSLDSLFFSSRPMVLGVGRSVLALAYLVLTLKQYLEWRGGAVRIYGFTARFRGRITLTGDAA